MRRPPLAELALALVSLLLSGLLAEAYLRRFHPVNGVLYRLHPRYLHELVPGARRLFVHQPDDGGSSLVVRVNRDGFLGPELRTGSRPRVVVYGDSFVAGEFSPEDERLTARLAAALAGPGRQGPEVVNAGVVGYGPDQAALRLQDELGRLRPDLVVAAVFAGNDFCDLVRNRLFRLDADGRLQSRTPRPSARLRAEFAKAERQAEGSRLFAGLRSLLAGPKPRDEHELLPPGGFRYLRDRRFREWALARASDDVDHLLGDPYDADLSLAPASESARAKRALMAAVLRRMAATAADRRVPIVFVFIPSAFDLAEGFPHPDSREFPDYRPSALTDALAESAVADGLTFLDLYPVFRAADRPPYFRADEHWNRYGQRLAAEHLAGLLRARGLLKDTPDPGQR